MLISRRVYGLAQKRGFVGGDLSADLARATREVDEQYEVDVQGLLRLTDPGEMVRQFQHLFASHGLHQRVIDRLLDLNREALEKLAEANQNLIESPSPYTPRQVIRLQRAAGEAIESLQKFSKGLSFDELNHQLEAPFQTVRDLLAGLNRMATPAAASAAAAGSGPPDDDTEFLLSTTIKAYHGLPPAELAEAPVSALRGLTEEAGYKLESAFGINSIDDLATCRLVARAASITILADAEIEALEMEGGTESARGRGAMAMADGPLEGFEGVTRRQARLMQDLLRVETVRDLAENRFVRVAQAIVALAET